MRKKVIGLLAGFLAFMLLFTILSRAADSMTVPKVIAQMPEQKKITHPVSGSGKVVPIREQAVSTEENQIVKEICTEEGARVKTGDVLFRIDPEELQEQILLAKQELEKLKLQQQDSKSGKEVKDWERGTAENRALEDYQNADQESGRTLQNAEQELSQAKEDLEAARKGSPAAMGDPGVKKVLKETLDQKNKAWEKAVAAREKLESDIRQEIDASIQEAEKNKSEGRSLGEPVQEPETAEGETRGQGTGEQNPNGRETNGASGALTDAEKKEIEAKVNNKYQTARKEAEKQVKEAEGEKNDAEAALKNYGEEQKNQASESAGVSIAQLEQAVKEKQAAYDAAAAERARGLQEASRGIEDAQAPSASDSTGEVGEIDQEQKELALAKLERLKEAGGEIKAPADGIVMKLELNVGQRTTDAPAILMADTAAGVRLEVQIPSDQEKYIARGDEVIVTPSENGEKISGLFVDSITSDEEESGFLTVNIKLSGQALEIGTAAEMEKVGDPKPYPVCVPVQALYQGENQQYYVLAVQETETVLGSELKAVKINVTVLDKNSTYAAVAEDSLNGENIIINTDRAIEDGTRVRLEET